MNLFYLKDFPDTNIKGTKKYFKAYYYLNGWYPINLGIHVDFAKPNIEIHVPFGFFRIGWDINPRMGKFVHRYKNSKFAYMTFGLQ